GEPHLRHLGEGARCERLRQARVVLDQDVPVTEQAEEDELDRIALSDDRTLDFVDDLAAQVANLLELHQSASDALSARSSAAAETPGAWRCSEAGRSGRTSSHASAPTTRAARSGSRSRSTPRRAASKPAAVSRSVGQSRFCRSHAFWRPSV